MSVADLNRDWAQLTTSDVRYRIAATREERAAAFQLVYSSYLKAGLGEPNPHKMRVMPYHLLPTTEIFLATLGDTPIFTMSLVLDGELGLPMECVYQQEVASRRDRGLVLAEVSCLADRRADFRSFMPVFFGLSRLMAQYAWRRGVHELLIAVHPKHGRFYRRYMAFAPFGELRAYPTVRYHPAVALALNFDQVDRDRPKSFDTFFGEWISALRLKPCPITEEDRDYFGAMVDPTFRFVPLESMDEASSPDAALCVLESRENNSIGMY
jgi:hypothetical protein